MSEKISFNSPEKEAAAQSGDKYAGSVLDALFKRRTFGIKPGLDTIRALLFQLGDPHRTFRAVHIAGTNGKGSVSAMLASILGKCGMRVGVYTSPHLVRMNERFAADGRQIETDVMMSLLEEVEEAANKVSERGGANATFFEITTALAFLWFRRIGVDVAVVECGLGGRLDATNILEEPVLSVVTRIGLDHTDILGHTVGEIAREKAGIIKPGRPVVVGAMPEDAGKTICSIASSRGSRLIRAQDAVCAVRLSGDLFGQRVRIESESEKYGTVNMKLAASYQLENIALAVSAAEVFFESFGVSIPAAAVREGLSSAVWPGRFMMTESGELADGAHNPDGAVVFVRALKDAGLRGPLTFVTGMCADKDIDGFMRIVSQVCGEMFAVPIRNPRSENPERLAARARAAGIRAVPASSLSEGLRLAHERTGCSSVPPVVCGSLYLVGELLEMSGSRH